MDDDLGRLLAEYEAWANGDVSEISDAAMLAGSARARDREVQRLLDEAVAAEFAAEHAETHANAAYLAYEDAARRAARRDGLCDPFAVFVAAKKQARATEPEGGGDGDELLCCGEPLERRTIRLRSTSRREMTPAHLPTDDEEEAEDAPIA